MCVGNLLDPDLNNWNILFEYMFYDPTIDEHCSECKYLPICMGGCPHKRLFDNFQRCLSTKHSFDKYMNVIPMLLKERKELENIKQTV